MKKTYYDKVKRINCLSNELDMLYHQAARKLEVSDSVLCILYMIYEKGDCCLLHEICQESGLSKQTINSALRKLEQEQFLYLELEQERGKAKRIRLTEKGKKYVARTAACLYEAECSAFADWTEEEFTQYLAFMKKYIDAFRIQVEKMERNRT